jgi:hypothetical protein
VSLRSARPAPAISGEEWTRVRRDQTWTDTPIAGLADLGAAMPSSGFATHRRGLAGHLVHGLTVAAPVKAGWRVLPWRRG